MEHYHLFFDGEEYMNSLNIDSAFIKMNLITEDMKVKDKLMNYFKTKDTLVLDIATDKLLNVWFVKKFDYYYPSAIGFGNLMILNTKTKKYEQQLLNITTTIIDKKETMNGKVKNTLTKTQSGYEIFSSDKSFKFYENTIVSLSEESSSVK